MRLRKERDSAYKKAEEADAMVEREIKAVETKMEANLKIFWSPTTLMS